MQRSDYLQEKSAISGVVVDQTKLLAFTHYSLRTFMSRDSNSSLESICGSYYFNTEFQSFTLVAYANHRALDNV